MTALGVMQRYLACTHPGGLDEIYTRFPKDPWELMENHGFSLFFNGFCMKMIKKSMLSYDFPRILGKSGVDLIQPPKICAGLVASTTALEMGEASCVRQHFGAGERRPALYGTLLVQ